MLGIESADPHDPKVSISVHICVYEYEYVCVCVCVCVCIMCIYIEREVHEFEDSHVPNVMYARVVFLYACQVF
jgi:hypothetical protein